MQAQIPCCPPAITQLFQLCAFDKAALLRWHATLWAFVPLPQRSPDALREGQKITIDSPDRTHSLTREQNECPHGRNIGALKISPQTAHENAVSSLRKPGASLSAGKSVGSGTASMTEKEKATGTGSGRTPDPTRVTVTLATRRVSIGCQSVLR